MAATRKELWLTAQDDSVYKPRAHWLRNASECGMLSLGCWRLKGWHTHQQAGLVGLDALRQRLLNVYCAADAVLCRPQRQLHLQQFVWMLATYDNGSPIFARHSQECRSRGPRLPSVTCRTGLVVVYNTAGCLSLQP